MGIRGTVCSGLVLWAAAVVAVGAASDNAGYEIDLGAAIKECSLVAEEERGYVQVSWVPVELWRYSISREEPLPEEILDLFLEPFRDYVITTVMVVRIEEPVQVEFASRDEIREGIRLRDKYGTVYEPVPLGKDDPMVALFAAVWEKIVAPQFGPVGGGVNLFLFPAEDELGRCIADPAKEGGFTLIVGEHEFSWELPLSSFLPPKICPACGRELSGVYSFCPYDGAKLEGQEVENPSEVAE